MAESQDGADGAPGADGADLNIMALPDGTLKVDYGPGIKLPDAWKTLVEQADNAAAQQKMRLADATQALLQQQREQQTVWAGLEALQRVRQDAMNTAARAMGIDIVNQRWDLDFTAWTFKRIS